MKKLIAILIVLFVFLPVTVIASHNIDLTVLTDEELDDLVGDVAREILIRKGYTPTTPTPVPTDVIFTDEVVLEITGGRLYSQYGTLEIQIEVQNASEDSAIDAFDFDVLAYNTYGEQVYQGIAADPTPCFANNINIKPGKLFSSKDSNISWMLPSSLSSAIEVHVSISRYHIQNEGTVIISDDKKVWVTFTLN